MSSREEMKRQRDLSDKIGHSLEYRLGNYVDNENFYNRIRRPIVKDINHDNSVGDGVLRNADIADRSHRSTIHTHCSFDKMNKLYRENLLRINIKQNHIRCGFEDGVDAEEFLNQRKTETEFKNLYDIGPCAMTDHMGGISTHITMEKESYSYIEGNDYTDRFAKVIHGQERKGVNSTQKSKHDTSVYPEQTNLYHDDNNTLTLEDSKIVYDGCDTILKKTKELFNNRKINSIVSRFYTEGDTEDSFSYGTAQVRGMSHGRNLLQKIVEKNCEVSDGYHINGYMNPYCRVWTHHYQYDQYGKAMRPFSTMNKDGSPTNKGTNHIEFHRWAGFQDANTGKLQHWKNNTSWHYSVFNKDNGLVNIHPYYDDQTDGKTKQVHTRQCMFSIENLAWKDYDPYSFEQALSWEQRGPNGGRIMWFPPYNLKISEDSKPEWNSNTFIGRGEKVYTYSNTERTGTIEFSLIIDHPSILDYLSMRENKMYHEGNVTDTDIHRFFAGCDTGMPPDSKEGLGNNNPNGYSLLNFVQPTHLDDEAPRQTRKDIPTDVKPEPIPEDTPPLPGHEANIEPDDEVLRVSFCAFYPNNYSGFYDRILNRSVEPIAYLLAGDGCNVEYDIKEKENTRDIECRFDKLPDNLIGYEMRSEKGISGDLSDKRTKKNYLTRVLPTSETGRKLSLRKDKDDLSPYFYRVDYNYQPYKNKNEHKYNTINQKLLRNGDYKDGKTFGLNFDVNGIKDDMKSFVDHDNLFSLFEVACAIAIVSKYEDTIKKLTVLAGQDITIPPSEEDILNKNGLLGRIHYLVKVFSEYELSTFEGYGFSNSHGFNANENLNKDRNNKLAEERYKSITSWVKKHNGGKWLGVGDRMVERKSSVSTKEKKGSKDVDSYFAKLFRNAACTMVFRTTKKSDNFKDIQKPNINGESSTNANVGSDNIYSNANQTEFQEKKRKLYNSLTVLSEIGKEGNYALLSSFGHSSFREMSLESIAFNHIFQSKVAVIFDKNFDITTQKDFIKYNAIVDKFNQQVDVVNSYGIFNVDKVSKIERLNIETIPINSERLKDYSKDIKSDLDHIRSFVEKDDGTINVMFIDKGNLIFYASLFIKELNVGDDTRESNLHIGLEETGQTTDNGKKLYKGQDGSYYVLDKNGLPIEFGVYGKYKDITINRLSKGGFRINDKNTLRYDQEYRFFRQLERISPTNFKKLTEKIQYFDPAFHSMSPEGFNARLTFLHQCTRQGFTKTRSDIAGNTANNLAFGRPPILVFRVGDFWHQMVIVTGMSIRYDDANWDFNTEGAGVQPMIANVSLNITFIGGGSVEGVIPRLQNALTFNYYANTSLYDNRSDRSTKWFAPHLSQIRDKSSIEYFSYVPDLSEEFYENLNKK